MTTLPAAPTDATRPIVSAIIGNWNGAAVLPDALSSLRAQSHAPLEVIVVDNGSSDTSEEVTRRHGARWLPMGRNAGLAAALNHGAAAAAGAFLVFLNNDMRFDPQFVEELLVALRERPGTFAVDATQFDWDGRGPIHTATFVASAGSAAGGYEVAPGLVLVQEVPAAPVDVFTASGAAMMVRRDLFERIGGFDPRLFLGYEDLDLCWRARLQGWAITFVPAAVAWHRVSAASSSAEGSPLRLLGTTVGRLLFATTWLAPRDAAWTWARTVAGLLRACVATRWPQVRARARALRLAARELPSLLRTRRRCYREAGCTPAAFLRAGGRVGMSR